MLNECTIAHKIFVYYVVSWKDLVEYDKVTAREILLEGERLGRRRNRIKYVNVRFEKKQVLGLGEGNERLGVP